MRQVLFRGKLVDTKKWVIGGGYYMYPNGRTLMLGISESDYPVVYEVIPETIGQMIGLFDSQKRPIWEGDKARIEIRNRLLDGETVSYIEIGVMQWISEFSQFRFKYTTEFEFDELKCEIVSVEVFGTIYD